MRAVVPIAVALAAALTASAGWTVPRPPAAAVSCDSAVLHPRSVRGERVVLRRVAFPRSRVFQVADADGPLPYWSKVGLYVRNGDTPVTVIVPGAWRSRLAVEWGDSGLVRAVRLPGCPASEHVWNGYAGGFYLRSPRACVPLVVRVGTRSTTIRFGLGRACD
jgi:hypothetical protein